MDNTAQQKEDVEMTDVPSLLTPASNIQVDASLTDATGVSSMQVDTRVFEDLQHVLPAVDPEHLRGKLETIGQDQNSVNRIVDEVMETENIPSRVDYLKRVKVEELTRQVTDDFDVAEFLVLYPDPVKHFTESPLQVTESVAREFLSRRYPAVPQPNIEHFITKHSAKLVSICQEMDGLNTRGFMFNCLSRFNPFSGLNRTVEVPRVAGFEETYHLMAFITHKDDIQEFLRQREYEKAAAISQGKSDGSLNTCACCLMDELLMEDIVSCQDGHLFCKDCVKVFAEVQISEGKATVPCLADCSKEILLESLKTVLKPLIYEKIDAQRRLEEVKAAGLEDFETCPFCDFGAIALPDAVVFTCMNPSCMVISCRTCKKVNHTPQPCDNETSEETKVRIFIEDRMTNALVRTCWKCKKEFFKEEGCNHMTCPCGAEMCYICRQPITGYAHFNTVGPNACRATSNDTVLLNVNAVVAEAARAKQEMAEQNPNVVLKHDPTRILPLTRTQEARLRGDRAAGARAGRVAHMYMGVVQGRAQWQADRLARTGAARNARAAAQAVQRLAARNARAANTRANRAEAAARKAADRVVSAAVSLTTKTAAARRFQGPAVAGTAVSRKAARAAAAKVTRATAAVARARAALATREAESRAAREAATEAMVE